MLLGPLMMGKDGNVGCDLLLVYGIMQPSKDGHARLKASSHCVAFR